MKRTLLLLLSLTTINLAACSSAPKMANPDKQQYCHTSEEINLSNGTTVDSNVTVQCSDEPSQRAKYVGVDPKSCRYWQKKVSFNGRTKNLNGYLCKDENNNWRPLNQF